MAYIFGILLVIVAGAVAASEEPTPCCAPDEYIINEAVIDTGINNGSVYVRETLVTRAFDFTNKLMGTVELSYDAETGALGQTKKIFIFPKSAEYVISGGKCTKKPLTYDLERVCVPPNSTFDKTLSIGLGQYTINQFSMTETQDPSYVSRAEFWVGKEKCIPYQLNYYQAVPSDQKQGSAPSSGPFGWHSVFYRESADDVQPLSLSIQYSNFNAGIPDPAEWFKVPAECKTSVTKQAAGALKMTNRMTNLFKTK